jgi:hypothetical protein
MDPLSENMLQQKTQIHPLNHFHAGSKEHERRTPVNKPTSSSSETNKKKTGWQDELEGLFEAGT